MPDVIARIEFPRTLKNYMKLFRMSQVDIAKNLGVTKQTVSDWINGKKYPAVNNMQALADLFGVYISDMTKPYSESSVVLPESALSSDEIELVTLWRGADDTIKQVVLNNLRDFQKKDTLSKAE